MADPSVVALEVDNRISHVKCLVVMPIVSKDVRTGVPSIVIERVKGSILMLACDLRKRNSLVGSSVV